MRDMMLVVAACSWIAGCTERVVVIRVPPQKQCASAERRFCPEQVDGLAASKAASAAEDRRSERRAPNPSVLASVSDAYGRDEDEAPYLTTRPVPAGSEAVQLALAASVDPSRLLTESITPLRDPARTGCDMSGKSSVCVPRQAGPVIVTDVISPPGCAAELYLGAADASGALRWAIPVTAAGTHGGNFFVRGDERVTVAVRGGSLTQAGQVQCSVTWAGFRPRIVPMMPGTNAATLAP